MADRARAAAPDVDAWVAARGPALLRLACTLTGGASDAEEQVVAATGGMLTHA